MRQAPFKFKQACSCRVGNSSSCHFTCMIGNTRDLKIEPCIEVPTLSATSQVTLRSLCGTITHLLPEFRSNVSDATARGTCSFPSQSFTPSSDPNPPTEPVSTRGVTTGIAGAQRTQDSTQSQPESSNSTHKSLSEDQRVAPQAAYPTDSKEREKARRELEKERGIERVVKKKVKIVEEHYDDCGDDMSSVDTGIPLTCMPCGCNTDEELSEEDNDTRLILWKWQKVG